MSEHLPGLGKQWVDAPGFIAWLNKVRPLEMTKHNHDGGGEGGRNAWATESELRALYRAEREGAAMKLEVADRICVKLGLHIDSELPEHLWADAPKRGRKKTAEVPVWADGIRYVAEQKAWVRAA